MEYLVILLIMSIKIFDAHGWFGSLGDCVPYTMYGLNLSGLNHDGMACYLVNNVIKIFDALLNAHGWFGQLGVCVPYTMYGLNLSG